MRSFILPLFLVLSGTASRGALIAEWRLDEASSNIVDSTGNHPAGVATGAPSYGQPGVPSGTYGSIIVTSPPTLRAIGFGPQNIDEYFTVGTSNNNPVMNLDRGASFTVMGWINPSAPPASGGAYRILSTGGSAGSDGGWGVSLFMPNSSGNNSAVRLTTYGLADNNSSTFNVVFGQWIHIAATYRDGNIDYFLNGSQLGGSDFSRFNNESGNGRLTIGSRLGGADFDQTVGRLDGIRVYNESLTPAQIAAAANASVVPEPRNAMLHLVIASATGAMVFRRRRRLA